jgi:hypothetical protein
MQITDLNKVINLFLVGSLALTIAALLWRDEIYSEAKRLVGTEGQFPASLGILLTTLLVLAIVMFVGCVIDGLAQVFIRRHFERLVERKFFLKLFFYRRQYEDTKSCRAKFKSLLKQSSKYQYISEEEDIVSAAALFFHTAKPQNITWLIQHQAVHVLATDYIALILIFTIAFIVFGVLHILGLGVKALPAYWLAIFIFPLYPLSYLSIDRWLYTYEVAYRNNIIVLCEEPSKADGE